MSRRLPHIESDGALHYYPDCGQDQVATVFSILERWNERSEAHFSQRRRHKRHVYQGEVVVERMNPLVLEGASSTLRLRALYHIPSRNVSQAGMGLIAPLLFVPKEPSEKTPPVRAELVLAEGTLLKIVLRQQKGTSLTLQGRIVRMRRVHHNFVDAGVQFLHKGDENEFRS